MNWEKIRYKKKTQDSPIVLNTEKNVPYFYFPLLEQTGVVNHGFSTRLGGVSDREFTSMNFVTTRGDSLENVKENYRRMGQAIGFDWTKVVVSYQTHTTNVRVVTREDAGEGIFGERRFMDVDGLITNDPEITLVTMYADCVPLYFVDPVKRVIGLSHSGWRGTVNRMGAVTVRRMQEVFDCESSDLLACIGPSICQDCYQVGSDVADAFRDDFMDLTREQMDSILSDSDEEGKYQLNLWKANEQVLLKAGILPEHLAVTNVCTCCNPDLLFSHRATKGKRGNLAAFLGLKEN